MPGNINCGTYVCPGGYVCGKTMTNPNYGTTSFDNIYKAVLLVFQTVTLEGWSQNMFNVKYAFNEGAYVYFIPIVFIGNFFLLNLTLAVIKSKFSEEHAM